MNSKLPHWQVPGADLLPKALPTDMLSPSALMGWARTQAPIWESRARQAIMASSTR
jgi:hypothetical protein